VIEGNSKKEIGEKSSDSYWLTEKSIAIEGWCSAKSHDFGWAQDIVFIQQDVPG
jgi:hypothetical protein